MSQDQDDLLMKDHEYDGIFELDNDLPSWWLAIFFGTIIFSFVYWLHYEVAGGPSTSAELQASMTELKAKKGSGPSFNEDTLLAAFTVDAANKGQAVFAAKCAMCHGPDGGGLIGPNLTDDFWINGNGSRLDIVKIIHEGVPAKGMPAWAGQIPEDEITQVAAFVYAMKGQNVAGGKPPQGQKQ